MRDLRIVFMGTPEFAVGTLSKLVENGFNVVGVITAPDKPSGRGRKLQQSAVKEYAVSKGIKVLQPVKLKDEDFLNELRELNANLQIVVAFRMLPEVIWKMPEFGTFNLHASLLPDYRGAAPINWVIINGETKTGVTTFFIDDKIDTGAMILKKEVIIDSEDNAGTLHDKLMETGSGLVIETVNLIKENKTITRLQEESETLKEAPKIHKETCRINWDKRATEIRDFIRGLSPYPTAWTLLNQNGESINVKIYDVVIDEMQHEEKTGMLTISKKSVKVAVKDGYVHLKEIQLPGKKKMCITDILNGFTFETDAHVL